MARRSTVLCRVKTGMVTGGGIGVIVVLGKLYLVVLGPKVHDEREKMF